MSDSGGAAVDTTKNFLDSARSAPSAFATGDVRISTTATLTAGTRTKDPNFQSGFAVVGPTGATAPMVARGSFQSLLSPELSRDPIILRANEGLVVEATVGGTGTWISEVGMAWDELTTI